MSEWCLPCALPLAEPVVQTISLPPPPPASTVLQARVLAARGHRQLRPVLGGGRPARVRLQVNALGSLVLGTLHVACMCAGHIPNVCCLSLNRKVFPDKGRGSLERACCRQSMRLLALQASACARKLSALPSIPHLCHPLQWAHGRAVALVPGKGVCKGAHSPLCRSLPTAFAVFIPEHGHMVAVVQELCSALPGTHKLRSAKYRALCNAVVVAMFIRAASSVPLPLSCMARTTAWKEGLWRRC